MPDEPTAFQWRTLVPRRVPMVAVHVVSNSLRALEKLIADAADASGASRRDIRGALAHELAHLYMDSGTYLQVERFVEPVQPKPWVAGWVCDEEPWGQVENTIQTGVSLPASPVSTRQATVGPTCGRLQRSQDGGHVLLGAGIRPGFRPEEGGAKSRRMGPVPAGQVGPETAGRNTGARPVVVVDPLRTFLEWLIRVGRRADVSRQLAVQCLRMLCRALRSSPDVPPGEVVVASACVPRGPNVSRVVSALVSSIRGDRLALV